MDKVETCEAAERTEVRVADWPGAAHTLLATQRRSVLRTLVFAFGGLASITTARAAESGPDVRAPEPWAKPRVGTATSTLPFVRVWADADGRTHVERRDIELSAEPVRGLFEQAAESFALRVIPPGMFFDWHKPSRRRMVAVLRGSATITLRDGFSAKVTPGMVLLVENTHGEGHRGNFDEHEFTITVDVGLADPQ